MRRQARPHHFARQAQLIEKLGLIVRDRAREHVRLPGGRRNLVALKLLDDLQRAVDAVQPASGQHVLPAIKELLELRGGNRLDFAAQLPERQAMDARQDAAIAPLDCSGSVGVEASAHHLAFGFELQQRRLDLVGWKRQRLGQRWRRDRAERLHPAAHGGKRFVAQIEALGGDPELLRAAFGDARAAGAGELVEECLPLGEPAAA